MDLIFQIWVNFLVFFVAITLAPGVGVREGLKGYLVAGCIYVFLIMVLPRAIEFFKVNVNFWSFLVFGVFVSVGYFFIMKYILVGFLSFEVFPATKAMFGLSILRGIELSQTAVVIFAGFWTIFLTAFNQWLIER